MPSDVQFDWHTDDVIAEIETASAEVVHAVAFQVLNYAQLNILNNDQIDTGFMWNSGYVRTPDLSTYIDTEKEGVRRDKQGHRVDREKASEAVLPIKYDALVAFAAVYALEQEIRLPFLFPALEQAIPEVGGIIKIIAKKRGLT